jgi:Trk-type K+ transport system membrane component
MAVGQRLANHSRHAIKVAVHRVYNLSQVLIPLLVLANLALIIFDFGFHPFRTVDRDFYQGLSLLLRVLFFLMTVRFLAEWNERVNARAHVFSALLVVLTGVAVTLCWRLGQPEPDAATFWRDKLLLYAAGVFLFLSELSVLLRFVYRRRVNPSFLFVFSFVALIGVGGLLLLLPTATTSGISFLDALFTSASAVCVTGLTVVDTATAFSGTGKLILLVLIQIGGLGIMTFTGLLTYLAAGSVSVQNHLALTSMVNTNRVGSIISVVSRIVWVTLAFEGVGAMIIYSTFDASHFARPVDHLFVSVFHSVSAFCNAGFSTFSLGLYDPLLRYNYPLQSAIAVLVVLGGMGFPIVFNIFSFARQRLENLVRRLAGVPAREASTRLLQVNSRLALATTVALLAVGFGCYLVFEWNATLRDHSSWVGKCTTAFFGAVTPRTAGFNTVNMAELTLPTIMIYLLLMWIGASPGSTGGGIKTTTAAVAYLNLRSVILGHTRTEAFRTQISDSSIQRAFAVMALSLLVIGLAVLIISANDVEKGLLPISFEVFSAYSTVGLSLGITAGLSAASKSTLIVVMLVGRVGALTLLMALVRQVNQPQYLYPKEDILY